MARYTITATKDALGAHIVGPEADAVSTVASTNVAADIAVLVADGVLPTQAHVTTLDGHWTTLSAGLGAVPSRQNLVVSFDGAQWNKSTLREALRRVMDMLESGVGGLTP